MTFQDYIRILREQTNSQPYQQQLEFALIICKKLYPEYVNFVKVYNWGNADFLFEGIKLCEESTIGNNKIDHINSLLPKLISVIPHMDDYGTAIGSYALNASAAVYETLEYIIDKDRVHIYNVANYYTDTIDFKIQEDVDLTDAEIASNSTMLEAWNYILKLTKDGA
jgi:uncharacterized protein